MRYFLMMLLFLTSCGGLYSQGKPCAYPFGSIIMVDSLTSLQQLDTIKSIPLKTYNRKGKIPRFIKKSLNCWEEGKFRIANPGHAFYISDAVGWWPLPHRQLMYLGLSDHYLLISYIHGGWGVNCPTILFKFDNKHILAVWYWVGFNEEIKTKEDILQYYGKGYPDGWQNRSPNL